MGRPSDFTQEIADDLAELRWSRRGDLIEFRGHLGGYYRIIFGADRARLEAVAREMAMGRA